MTVTVNLPQRRVVAHWPQGEPTSHYLSRIGISRLHAWLMDNGRLLWGWADVGEYHYRIEVSP